MKQKYVSFAKKLYVVVVGFGLILGVAGCGSDPEETEKLAKCLTEKGAVMYGAYWCGHCTTQKKMFGDSFQYINYIECTDEEGGGVAACAKEKINGLPTWIFADGVHHEGAQQFKELAELSGCEYNEQS